MSFEQFGDLFEVLNKYSLTYQEMQWQTFPQVTAPKILKHEIDFILNNISYSSSIIGKNFIYPVLRYAWKNYADILTIWNQTDLNYNKELSGISDYLIAKRSPLEQTVLDLPYIAVVETKYTNFITNWGKCAAQMLAMQKINNVNLPVYGIVSNGKIWQIAQLQQQIFTLYSQRFDIIDCDVLFSVLTSLLESCKENILMDYKEQHC